MVLVGGGGAWPGFETTRRATSATTALLVWSVPEELVGLAAVPVGGGGAWMGFETTRRSTSATTALLVWRARQELVGLLWCWWAAAGPGWDTHRKDKHHRCGGCRRNSWAWL